LNLQLRGKQQEKKREKMWIFGWKGPSGFSARSTAEEVTQGIDGTGLTAVVTGLVIIISVLFPLF